MKERDIDFVATEGLVKAFQEPIQRPLNTEIDQVLFRSIAKDLPIISLAYCNLAVFTALLFAASGLQSKFSIAYVFFVAFIGIVTNLIGRFASKRQSDKVAKAGFYLSLILGEFALASILMFDMAANERANYYTALATVASMSLVSIALSARFVSTFVLSKIGVIILCCIFIFSVPVMDGRAVEIASSLVIVLLIMISIGYWIIWRGREQVVLRLQLTSALNLVNEAKEKLEDAHSLRQRMVSYVGHDLRQPLNAASYTLLEFSKRRESTSPDQLISDMEESLKSAGRMIENIVQISHFDNPEIEVIFEPFDVEKLFFHIERDYHVVAKKSGCNLRYVPTRLRLTLDADLLTRILRNLTRNAIKHSGAKGLLLGVKRVGENVEIWVADNGRGMKDTALQAQRHKPYSPGTDNTGLGIGLEISKQLARACGCSFHIDSEPNKGTICRIQIPNSYILDNI